MPKPTPLSISEVIAKFPTSVRERYDFTDAVYHGALVPMTGIKCAEHGEFKQYVAQLRKDGAGCPTCGEVQRRNTQRNSVNDLMVRAAALHGSRYTYERMTYRNTQTKVTVTCPDHGDFTILPINHFYGGQGCPACGALKRGRRKDPKAAGRATADTKLANFAEKFVTDARAVHGDVYDYTETVYRGRRQKLVVRCPQHGPFEQVAMNHIDRAQGCPQCSHHRSKGEAEIFRFVSIFADARERDRSVIAPKELDIYVPEHRLAIEFCGEYWHGADKAEDEPFARRRHAEKFLACQAQGIRLLTLWWSEWEDSAAAVRQIIRNALGKTHGSVGARRCDLKRVGRHEAAAFFDRYHVQGGAGHGQHYGLYLRGRLLACMRFTEGANDRGVHANRTWTLSRYATRISVPGGASRLFKAFVDDNCPEIVKSFSDNRLFDGALYERLGFHKEAEIEPDYQVYHQRLGLLPKSAWQRKNIPARIRELGSKETFDPDADPRSERDMTFLLGALRLYDCGKKRWVWTQASDLV